MPKTREELEQEAQNQPAIPEVPAIIPTEDSQTPVTTQPTNTPPVVTQEQLQSVHNLYGEALREQSQKAERLERELADARRTPVQQVNDSDLTPEQLIAKHISAAVKPLQDEFSLFRASQQQNVYQNLKNQFRNLPQMVQFFPAIEPYVDQEMNGKDPTVQNLQSAIAKVIGLIQMQQMTQPTAQPTVPVQNNQPNNLPVINNQPRNDQMLPPHLRPSNPPAPDRSNDGVIKTPLTELQKRVARERGMSEADYRDWLSVDPRDVVKSTIGIPQPK